MYSLQVYIPEIMVRVYGRNLPISRKKSVEIARFIKYLPLEKAKQYLQEVIELKRPVPFRRYKRDIPHRKELQGYVIGRYPVKPAKYFLKLLHSLEKNAEYKGLDKSKLIIIHAAAHKGTTMYKPGKLWIRVRRRKATHVEIVAAVIDKYDPSKRYKRKELEKLVKEFLQEIREKWSQKQ